MAETPESVLQKYWGYPSFRPLQKDIIQTILDRRDVLAILPTGAGKSLCYQIPGLILGGICLVISPLIALMRDQVSHLRNRGIQAACIHSGLTRGSANNILEAAIHGDIQFLYVSPERLKSESFLDYLKDMDIRLIAIDEAHCIAQWGHDFRPPYLEISKIRPFLSQDTVWMALTATATPKVKQEILKSLALQNPKIFKQSIYRPNLVYQVPETDQKLTEIVDLFKTHPGSGILYCPTRNLCMEMEHWLIQNGIKALAYHAGLPKEVRASIQENWSNHNDIVVCATSAFGMGIDKGDVPAVVHLFPPESLEAYYQEAGRAGRNGETSYCVLLFRERDLIRLRERPEMAYPPRAFVIKIYNQVGDYLGIPIGSGLESSYPFDILDFVGKFNLPLTPTLSALKLLEQEGYFIWERSGQLQSAIQVTATEQDLNQIKTYRPELWELVIAILRLHGGVLNFPMRFKLWEITQYLKWDQPKISASLKKLEGLGLVDYTPGFSGSFLYYSEGRIQSKFLSFNMARIRTLKKAMEERIRWMIHYLTEPQKCRTKILAQYFGEDFKEDCHHCDNCMKREKDQDHERQVVREIREILREQGKCNLQILSSQFKGFTRNDLVTLIRELQDEGFCRIDSDGTIVLK